MTHVQDDGSAGKRAYVAPTITVMNEEDVLKTFQLTSAMGGWWISPGLSG